MSLEVDGSTNGHLYTISPEKEAKIQHNQGFDDTPIPQHVPPQYANPQHASPHMFHQVNGNMVPMDERISRIRRTNTFLLVAFLLALVAAIVAAAVGGSLAANRQHQITSLQSQLTDVSNGTCPSAANDPTASPANNSTTPPPRLISNCSSFTSLYTSSAGSTFTTHCGNDLTGGSTPPILGVYLYTFADCINACASYNVQSAHAVQRGQTAIRPNGTCAAVSWNRALIWPRGNCYLKPAIESSLSANASVDTATLNS